MRPSGYEPDELPDCSTLQVDLLGFEPRTFSVQGSCSSQLELQAHDGIPRAAGY